MEKKIKQTEEEKDVTPKIYEVGYLLLPSLAEENLAGEVALIKAVIEQQGGTFISEESPKLRNLTYTMSKLIDTKKQRFDKGYFGWIKFEVAADALVAVKAGLEANLHVLRFLLINTVRENTLATPKIMAQKKIEADKLASEDEGVVSGGDEAPVVAAANDAEIDKSIEELVIG